MEGECNDENSEIIQNEVKTMLAGDNGRTLSE